MFGKHHRTLLKKQMNPNLNKHKETKVKVTVKKHSSVDDGHGYAEIGQSQNTKQALLMRDGPTAFTRLTGFVKCRDFLVDTYSYAKENKDFGIYGFSFAGSKMQPDWKGAHIQMRFAEPKSRENFLEHVKQVIHPIEAANGFDLTDVLEIEGEKLDLVAVGDKKWLMNCLSFSLWSLLLRCCCYSFDAKKDWIKTFSALGSSDSKYIASIERGTLDKLLGDLSLIKTKEFCGFDPKKDAVHMIHHNSGAVSVFGSHTEINPSTVVNNGHWKEFYKRGDLKMHPKTVACLKAA